MSDPCARRPITETGYVAWHDEAERRTAAGWTQEQCPCCLRWTRWYTPGESRGRHDGS